MKYKIAFIVFAVLFAVGVPLAYWAGVNVAAIGGFCK